MPQRARATTTASAPASMGGHEWRAISELCAHVQAVLGRQLEQHDALCLSEYQVLDVLARQPGSHMRMQQLANAVVLSQSATTRLVARLEERGLLSRVICDSDRRGIYTGLTAAGSSALKRARKTHDAALGEALAIAAEVPELAPVIRALNTLNGESAPSETPVAT